jgi:hypothetical protein
MKQSSVAAGAGDCFCRRRLAELTIQLATTHSRWSAAIGGLDDDRNRPRLSGPRSRPEASATLPRSDGSRGVQSREIAQALRLAIGHVD